MSRYPEADLNRIRTYPVRTRRSLVAGEAGYRPPADPASFTDFWDSLPETLAARDLKELVRLSAAARRSGHGMLVLCGAHVIKAGVSPALIRLMEDGWITALATNGAGAIHDLELAFFGRTSEDVAAQLPAGRFGMARETSSWLNDWTIEAAARGEGLGEGLGRAFLERGAPGSASSLLATAYRLSIPATVHLAIGADINHQHPGFNGAAAGETTARDFRILCRVVQGLERGIALNIGSAVILPEVFLKAVSVGTNLGARYGGLTTAVFDFIRHYRPAENVVRRPALQGGKGFYLVGHHEILVPLFTQALLLAGGGSGTGRSERGKGDGKAAGVKGGAKTGRSTQSDPPTRSRRRPR